MTILPNSGRLFLRLEKLSQCQRLHVYSGLNNGLVYRPRNVLTSEKCAGVSPTFFKPLYPQSSLRYNPFVTNSNALCTPAHLSVSDTDSTYPLSFDQSDETRHCLLLGTRLYDGQRFQSPVSVLMASRRYLSTSTQLWTVGGPGIQKTPGNGAGVPPPKPGDVSTAPPPLKQPPSSNKDALKAVSTASGGASANSSTDVATSPPHDVATTDKPKSLGQRIIAEIKHYYHGFRLLALDMKIALRLVFKVARGHTLTRREKKQLVRTTADMIRLVPFIPFLIIPFAEFLLPFYIKFFPFMLPSTFKEEEKADDKKEKTRQLLKGKLEMAKFLQDTLAESSGVKSQQSDDTPTVNEFKAFMKQMSDSGQMAETKDIVRYSRLFEDEVTLASLEGKQLKALCQLLDLYTDGPDQYLRFRLRLRIRILQVDDKMIFTEGVDQLPVWELQALCRERGMRALGVSESRLRNQLSQWLELSLKQNVPITLLLFSRLFLPEALISEEQIKQAIASMPKAASNEAALKAAESSTERLDNKTKLEVLKAEEAQLKKEQAELKKAKEIAKAKAAAAAAAAPPPDTLLKDSAQPIVDTSKPIVVTADTTAKAEPATSAAQPTVAAKVSTPVVEKDIPIPMGTRPEIQAEITAKDLEQIESAIGSLKETQTALDEEELDDLKEDVAKITKQQESSALISPEKTKQVNKAASRLASRVNSMISDMDHLIDTLHDEKREIQEEIEVKEIRIRHQKDESTAEELQGIISSKKERLIGINDLMLSLRRIQKVPDDTRWQQILEVLDEDHDGQIEMSHVLEVIELMGAENVKLTPEEMGRVLDILEKEAALAKIMRTEQESAAEKPASTTSVEGDAPSTKK